MTFKTGVHLSRMGREEKYDSSFELRRFKALDAHPKVREWTRSHGIRIPYHQGGKIHHYQPDILVTMEDGTVYLEEVKGRVFDTVKFVSKNLAARLFCESKGWKFRLVFAHALEFV